MILIDTAVIVAWLDPMNADHARCVEAVAGCAASDRLALSTITLAELAATGRSRAAIEEDLSGFEQIAVEAEAALYAGAQLFRDAKGKQRRLSLAELMILGQAATLKLPILRAEPLASAAAKEVDILIPLPGPGKGGGRRHAQPTRPKRKVNISQNLASRSMTSADASRPKGDGVRIKPTTRAVEAPKKRQLP
jgi:predicted nucleic acid-binding protein